MWCAACGGRGEVRNPRAGYPNEPLAIPCGECIGGIASCCDGAGCEENGKRNPIMPDEQSALDLAGGGDEKKRLPILMLDFDGVLHSYSSGWQGADRIPDPPVAGFAGFLERAVEHFDVAVHSSRSAASEGRQAMADWLRRHLAAHYRETMSRDRAEHETNQIMRRVSFPADKPAAFVSLDDRCLNFTGQWPDIAELRAFRPWWG